MTGNNQTQGRNQQSGNKKNYSKNQPNVEHVLWENQQDRQTLSQTHYRAQGNILITLMSPLHLFPQLNWQELNMKRCMSK